MCFTFAQHCSVIDLNCSYTQCDFGAEDDNLCSKNKWQYYCTQGDKVVKNNVTCGQAWLSFMSASDQFQLISNTQILIQ